MPTNENAAPGWLPGSGVENNCACHFSPASAAPSIGPASAGRIIAASVRANLERTRRLTERRAGQ